MGATVLLSVVLKLQDNILSVVFCLFWLGLVMRQIDSRADSDVTAGTLSDRVSLSILALLFLKGTRLVDLLSF